ncbi:hypothetical protein KC322_g14 [Hortaea werneckii]|nr:hypothetical protein KC322_g14 [Hortaea werneckii]
MNLPSDGRRASTHVFARLVGVGMRLFQQLPNNVPIALASDSRLPSLVVGYARPSAAKLGSCPRRDPRKAKTKRIDVHSARGTCSRHRRLCSLEYFSKILNNLAAERLVLRVRPIVTDVLLAELGHPIVTSPVIK